MDTTPLASRRQENLLLATLAAMQFVNVIDFMIVMPLGPRYLREMGLTGDGFAWIVSSYGYAACVMGLAAGLFVDRFARRDALLATFVGFTVGTALCGAAESFAALVAGRVVTGLFGGVLGGLCMAMIGDVIPKERRGAATGLVMGAFSVASVLGVPAGLALAESCGRLAPFRFLVLLCLLILPLAWWSIPRFAPRPGEGSPLARFAATFARVEHLKAFLLMALLMLAGFSVIPFLSVYMTRNVGMAEQNLMYIYLCGGLAAMVSMPLIGRLSDRFGQRPTFWAAAAVSLVPLLLATHLPPAPLAAILATTTLFMVCMSGRAVPAMALIIGSAAPALRGGFSTANAAVQHFASGLAVSIGGRLMGEAGAGPVPHYDRVGWFAAAMTVAAMVLAAFVGPAASAAPVPAPELPIADALPVAEELIAAEVAAA